MIGGTGWVSTIDYYKLINEGINERLGGLNYARCILYSLDYGDIARLNKAQDMKGLLDLIINAAEKLNIAGAECILLCANTMHRFAGQVSAAVPLPLIHIAEATASEIQEDKFTTVGLLGTRQTMELDFYKSKLAEAGISTITPNPEERTFVDNTITNELLKNIFTEGAIKEFLKIIDNLVQRGAQGIVLGCTEIPLLIKQSDTSVKVYHTTSIHANAAVNFALS